MDFIAEIQTPAFWTGLGVIIRVNIIANMLLGSVATKGLHLVDVPVLLVK